MERSLVDYKMGVYEVYKLNYDALNNDALNNDVLNNDVLNNDA